MMIKKLMTVVCLAALVGCGQALDPSFELGGGDPSNNNKPDIIDNGAPSLDGSTSTAVGNPNLLPQYSVNEKKLKIGEIIKGEVEIKAHRAFIELDPRLSLQDVRTSISVNGQLQKEIQGYDDAEILFTAVVNAEDGDAIGIQVTVPGTVRENTYLEARARSARDLARQDASDAPRIVSEDATQLSDEDRERLINGNQGLSAGMQSVFESRLQHYSNTTTAEGTVQEGGSEGSAREPQPQQRAECRNARSQCPRGEFCHEGLCFTREEYLRIVGAAPQNAENSRQAR